MFSLQTQDACSLLHVLHHHSLTWLNTRTAGPLKTDKGGFSGGPVVKNLPTNVGIMDLTLGPGRSHRPQNNWVVCHSYWACVLKSGSSNSWIHAPPLPKPVCPRDHPLQQEKPPQLESSPCLLQLEKSLHSNEDPLQSKIKQKRNL